MACAVIAIGCGGKSGPADSADALRAHSPLTGLTGPTGPGPKPRCPAPSSPGVLGGPVPVSPQDFSISTSNWIIAGHCQEIEILAGSEGGNRHLGKISIQRTTPLTAITKGASFLIPGVGPLTITKAPLGERKRVSAWHTGEITFKSRNGTIGVLHLRNDRIHLDCPRVCPKVSYGHYR